MDTGNTTQDALMLSVLQHDPARRREAAIKLIEAGMSQRAAAKVLGVSHSTVRADLEENLPQSGRKSSTGSAATTERRAEVAADASASGVAPTPTEKYRIVYADPPWSYGNTQPDYHTEQRDHYPVMELQAICDLPVAEWVEDDAVLFLWVTSPILEEAFDVIRAWGFNYKASFIWDKIKHNMGHYNSVRHELLLICTRGSCQPDVKTLIDSVQSIERSNKHSQKPVEFYDIIETIYTHGRRLEMFSRERREGWEAYGHIAEIQEAAE
jgi:N6-adenosine-specific RNA methylase IME4/predicted transcriptional regulator